jgi:chromosome segregation ATPase
MSDTPRTDAEEKLAREKYEYLREAGDPNFDDSPYLHARTLETELAAAKKRIADCEFVMAHRYDIIERQEPRCNEANARAEKAEASLHNVSLDLSTANHMIKLERDRADALQTRLNEIDAMLKSPDLID